MRKTDAAEAWSKEKIDSLELAKYTKEMKVWKMLAVKPTLSSPVPTARGRCAAVLVS